eukprot:TCONS_00061969-protein
MKRIWGSAVLVIVFGIFIISIKDILLNVEENGCTMTWMYEYPKYIPVPMGVEIKNKFPKYNLFVYGEGAYAQHLFGMRDNIQLDGVPALFVHGNSGRYKQVRSPGSVSLSKSERKAYHFNYFSVDYEEEFSALFGEYLHKQTLFLSHVIDRVFECYQRTANKPTSLILIGHSMGGMVIRGLFTLPHFDHNQINTVITLATPHLEPPINLDPRINEFYDKVNRYWIEHQNKVENLTFLSLGGGFRDYLVRSDLCLYKRSSPNHFTTLTTSLPRIWLSNDHQCIVWCNQLVRALTRTFFNMIDPKSKQITNNHKKRTKILLQTLFYEKQKHLRITLDFNECSPIDYINNKITLIRKRDCVKVNISESGQIVDVWYHSNKIDSSLIRCDPNQKCKTLNFATQLPDDSQFISIKTEAKNQYYLNPQYGDLHFSIGKILDIVNRIQLPLLNGLDTDVSLPTSSFYHEINLHGYSATWQCFKVEILGAKKKIIDSPIIKIENPESSEINVKSFSNNELHKLDLKFFTVPTDGTLKMYIWSRKEFATVRIKLTIDWESSLGQLTRFQTRSIARYTLVLYTFQKCSQKSSVQSFAVLFAFAKTGLFILEHHLDGIGVLHYFYQIVFPEMYSFVVSMSTVFLLDIIGQILWKVVRGMTFRYISITNSRALKLIWCLIIVLISSTIYYSFGSVFVLIPCFIAHLITECVQQSNKRSDLLAFLPTTLAISIVPYIVTVKDVLLGFPIQSIRLGNIDPIALGYVLYMISFSTGFQFTLAPPKMVTYVLPFIFAPFMCKELVNFYNVGYLALICMAIKRCSFHSEEK